MENIREQGENVKDFHTQSLREYTLLVILVVAVVWFTVPGQVLKAANSNPTEVLTTEGGTEGTEGNKRGVIHVLCG